MYFPDLDWNLHTTSTMTVTEHLFRNDPQADANEAHCNDVRFDSALGSRLTIIIPRRRRLKFKILPDDHGQGLVLALPMSVNRRRERTKHWYHLSIRKNKLFFELLDQHGNVRSSSETMVLNRGHWMNLEL